MSTIGMYLRLALRNVARNPRRSGLTILAIAFGLFCLIVFQALKVGMHREMIEGTLALDSASLQIHAADYESNLAVLKPMRDVETAMAALQRVGAERFGLRLKAPALLLAGPRSSSVVLAGVDPAREPGVTLVAKRMVAGAYLGVPDTVVMGQALAQDLGLDVGGTVRLMAQNGSGMPAVRNFRVGGLFRTGLDSFDRGHVYFSLPDAQGFLSSAGAVTEIAANMPPDQAGAIAGELRQILRPENFQVRTWEEVLPDLKQLIELNDATMGLLIAIVFAIVGMGIANTMSMVVFERFREFGVLAAIGTTPSGIVGLVMLESILLGVLATLVGSVAGLAACVYLQHHGIDMSHFISNNQYFAASHVLRAELRMSDLLLAGSVTLATALLAGIYPAWRAGRLEPVKALAHT
ncbi:ABC-type transport system, involved in lipoprotein release, permease component [Desulfocurvibacter africanus PCS]|uniref:ABC-type transport system, involved in lipoprotein release, permease component n=2 Tax=Desulfocurvibacter africanus TaxID=873 RepID=M5PP22_DESAF|nr:ABC-type transport system, involved in lipoprotein release, permease component [Desulfocurvibacter africanus PCS]